ncbi:MAG: glycerate kinase, partial [Dehalococcoidia bacterium]
MAAQEFKGSLTAAEACDAIGRGIAAEQPTWELDVVPLADGGPGFLDAFLHSTDATEETAETVDALRRPTRARYLRLRRTGEVIIEAAQSNGLTLIAEQERDALRAGTEGVGTLLRAALRPDTVRVMVGVGGTATSDGGTGMARSLGALLLDAEGQPLEAGVEALLGLARIVWEPGPLTGPQWLVATDVTSPLLGPRGSAAVFSPQKGATDSEVDIIERALERFALIVRRDLGVDLIDLPGAGAGGGLAAGIVAFLGGRIVSGFEVVEALTGLRERLRQADLVVTGEGWFDSQTLAGKGPGRLLETARREGKPAVIFAGGADPAAGPAITIAGIEPDRERSMTAAE